MYTNGVFSGTYLKCRDYLKASIPLKHPENWPDGPWVKVQPELPAPISLSDRKQQALQQINWHYQQLAEQQIGQYPDFEIQTWQDQEREALEYQAWIDDGSVGDAPLTPTLTGIVSARRIALTDLVARVITNAAAWRKIAPTLAGERQTWAYQVLEATAVEQVDQIIEQVQQSATPSL